MQQVKHSLDLTFSITLLVNNHQHINLKKGQRQRWNFEESAFSKMLLSLSINVRVKLDSIVDKNMVTLNNMEAFYSLNFH